MKRVKAPRWTREQVERTIERERERLAQVEQMAKDSRERIAQLERYRDGLK